MGDFRMSLTDSNTNKHPLPTVQKISASGTATFQFASSNVGLISQLAASSVKIQQKAQQVNLVENTIFG